MQGFITPPAILILFYCSGFKSVLISYDHIYDLAFDLCSKFSLHHIGEGITCINVFVTLTICQVLLIWNYAIHQQYDLVILREKLVEKHFLK